MNIVTKMIEKNSYFWHLGLSAMGKHGIRCAVASFAVLSVSVFATEDITTTHVKFSGQFVLPTCDAAVYDANNTMLPSGAVLLPSLTSTEATTVVSAPIGEKVVFKIGPVNPQACIDLLSSYIVKVTASGFNKGNVLHNVSGSGPSNIGVEVLQESGAPILDHEATQNITPGDTNTSLVPFSAQLYNMTGGVPDANGGYILSEATFTTAYY